MSSFIHKRSKSNYLLAKDDVGKSKPTTRDLPQGAHSFGYQCKPDLEGVGARKSLRLDLMKC